MSWFLLVNHRRKKKGERERKRKEPEKSLRENWERLEQGNGRHSFNHLQHIAYQCKLSMVTVEFYHCGEQVNGFVVYFLHKLFFRSDMSSFYISLLV